MTSSLIFDSKIFGKRKIRNEFRLIKRKRRNFQKLPTRATYDKPSTISSSSSPQQLLPFQEIKTMKRFVETRHFSLPLFDSVNSSRASSTPSSLKAKIPAAIRVFRKRDEDGGRRALPAEIKGRRERERERVSLKFPAHCRAFGVRE